MSTFQITGGKPLYGSVRVGGAKNASYKLMIAALLGDTPSRLLNFSHISDVGLVANMISVLGAKAEQVGERAYKVDPRGLNNGVIPLEYGQGSRASTMFIPVLLSKVGRAEVPFPGGDNIGKRSLEWHFGGLEALGAKIEVQHDRVIATTDGLRGATYRFAKNSHTGTETLLIAAAAAEGTTVLENAAEETEVDDLIDFLNLMGAQIERVEPRTIKIQGNKNLHGAIFKIMPDQNQAVSFACTGIATKGDVIVENARAADLEIFLEKLDEIGAGYEVGNYGIRFFYKGPLRATDVTTLPHPGFKTDWQPLWVAMMTQAEGVSVMHETVTEKRFQYVDALNQMGAKIELFNPEIENPQEFYNFDPVPGSNEHFHAARITGPTPLTGGEFEIKDIRHGATLVEAGLIATGTTILHDPDGHIDRGYEELDQQFAAMGAEIKRVP